MKIRRKSTESLKLPPAREAARDLAAATRKTRSSASATDKPRSSNLGGARPGAGRPAYLKAHERKAAPAYVSMTREEKEKFEALAAEDGLTLSFYIRRELGLPIE